MVERIVGLRQSILARFQVSPSEHTCVVVTKIGNVEFVYVGVVVSRLFACRDVFVVVVRGCWRDCGQKAVVQKPVNLSGGCIRWAVSYINLIIYI